eukprot:gene25618-34185_t
MSKSNTKGKKTVRAQKKDFENVLNDLSVEQAELSTIPSVHKTLFILTGFLSSLAPIVLYLSPVYLLALSGIGSKAAVSASIYDGKVLEKTNWIYYVASSLVSGCILVAAMNVLALKTRKYLFISREPIPAADESTASSIKSALKQLNATESSSYSIFTVNSFFLGLFLLFVAYVLPTYEMTEQYNYLTASLLSSVLIYTLSALLL